MQVCVAIFALKGFPPHWGLPSVRLGTPEQRPPPASRIAKGETPCSRTCFVKRSSDGIPMVELDRGWLEACRLHSMVAGADRERRDARELLNGSCGLGGSLSTLHEVGVIS